MLRERASGRPVGRPPTTVPLGNSQPPQQKGTPDGVPCGCQCDLANPLRRRRYCLKLVPAGPQLLPKLADPSTTQSEILGRLARRIAAGQPQSHVPLKPLQSAEPIPEINAAGGHIGGIRLAVDGQFHPFAVSVSFA